MDSFARNFVISALLYLGLMALFGLALAFELPYAYFFRYTHIHLGLVGWMSMMIYGVGYHVIPRFAGRTIYSKKLGHIHWWCANLGLVGMGLFFPLKMEQSAFRIPFMIAASVQTFGIFCFVFNIMMSWARPKRGPSLQPLPPDLAAELSKLKGL